MFKKILLGIVVLVAGLSVFVMTRPASFHYVRSMAIDAPPETLFPYINDVHKFQEWNPFSEEDPEGQITFTGPNAGLDAAAHWNGSKSGEGSMTIVESKPAGLVRYRMDFRRPFAATHTAEFTLEPKDGKTVVSWSLSGNNNFIGKALTLVIDCDKLCGDQFLKGLNALKALVEKRDRQD